MKDPLTAAIIELFTTERFYAELILRMDREISKRVPTAGVSIRNNIHLVVNPDFFSSISERERVAVLIHECGHILNDHIPRFKVLSPEVFDETGQKLLRPNTFKVMNVAADLSLNCNIQNIPKGGQMPSAYGLENGETFEWYFEELKKNPDAQKLMEYDDHGTWHESEGDPDEIREKIKGLVKSAADSARAAGKMTASDELLVERLLYKPRDWKADMRRFAANQTEVKVDSSRRKRNRRYGIKVPGIIKTETLHLGVAIDTSGSMSDEAINQAMAEIGNMAKYATITVAEADSEIKQSYQFDPKKQYSVKGRGGTAYQPAFAFFNNLKVDGVIYIGDMDCGDESDLVKPRYPVLWVIIGPQDPPVKWGSRTRIDINKK